MNNQSSENYLDALLNSVKKKENFNSEDEWKMPDMTQAPDIPIRMASRGELHPNFMREKMSAKAEAEFLMEFEQELEGMDYENFLREFDEQEVLPEDNLDNIFADAKPAAMDDVAVESVAQDDSVQQEMFPPEEMSAMEAFSAVGGFTADETPTGEAPTDDLPLEELSLEEMLLGDIAAEEPTSAAADSAEELSTIDLSEMGEEDLISLLAQSNDLSELGDLLAKSQDAEPITDLDEFDAFAQNEMQEQQMALDMATEPSAEGKPKSGKKGGLFAKLKAMLFGAGEQEEPLDLTTSEASVEELSDESAKILAAFSEAEQAEAPKQGKKKKEKKEKKAKAPKAKKAPKAPKEKKPKAPKEVDNTPPLPKGPVALVLAMAASLLLFLYLGTGLVSYHTNMKEAENFFNKGQYTEAANVIGGMKIKEADMILQGKIATLATADSEFSAYQVFWENERKEEALDSLICAAGRCELNMDSAEAFECVGQMENLKTEVANELRDNFGLTYEKAIEMYQMKSREEYTLALEAVMTELGIR